MKLYILYEFCIVSHFVYFFSTFLFHKTYIICINKNTISCIIRNYIFLSLLLNLFIRLFMSQFLLAYWELSCAACKDSFALGIMMPSFTELSGL